MAIQEPTGLNATLTFENFQVTPNNDFGYEAALDFAGGKLDVENPLFIYGGDLSERTHLLHAIGNYRFSRSHIKAAYVHVDMFLIELQTAVRRRNIGQFRRKYDGAELLLMGEVSCLGESELAQEECSRLFNRLFDAHISMAFTARAPPDQILALDERLASRFAWGKVVEI